MTEGTTDFRDFRTIEEANKEKVSWKRKGEVRKSLEKKKTLETEYGGEVRRRSGERKMSDRERSVEKGRRIKKI